MVYYEKSAEVIVLIEIWGRTEQFIVFQTLGLTKYKVRMYIKKRIWAYLKRYSKRRVFSYKIRKEETSMELLEKILDDKNLFNAYE